MKCSKCDREAVGFVVTEWYRPDTPLVWEARCKFHLHLLEDKELKK